MGEFRAKKQNVNLNLHSAFVFFVILAARRADSCVPRA